MSDHFQRRTDCRLCGSPDLELMLSLGDQYVIDFVREVDLTLPRAPVELMMCRKCGLLQLSCSVDSDILWGDAYWYRSSVNQSMRRALRDVVADGLSHHHEGVWMDIGANDGYLLSQVPRTFTKIAVEPARGFKDLLGPRADRVISDFFSAAAIEEIPAANIITSCAMFYDVDDPVTFCKDVAGKLEDGGVWINQLSHAEGMLQANAWDAICHEHRAYYSLPVLQRIYREAGLQIISTSMNDVNGGSARVVATKGLGSIYFPPVTRDQVVDFAGRYLRWRDRMRWILEAFQMSGMKVWGLGASTKGCCLLQCLDMPDALVAIADRNPIKNGLLMAGTWLRVTDEETMRKEKPDVLLALPWGFKRELLEREAETLKSGTAIVFPLPEISISL